MKKTILLSSVALLFFFASACKKKKIVEPANSTAAYPLTLGSYWVYQSIKRDAVGAPIVLLPEFDSTVVTRDTVIRGETFKILMQFIFDDKRALKNIFRSILRDSSEHIIDPSGNKYYFPESRTDVLRRDTVRDWSAGGRPIAHLTYTFTDRDSIVKTPAGSFQTLNFRTRFAFVAPYSSSCKGCLENERFRHSHYSHGIGKVFEIGLGNYTEFIEYGKQLVRYKIVK